VADAVHIYNFILLLYCKHNGMSFTKISCVAKIQNILMLKQTEYVACIFITNLCALTIIYS